MRIEHLALNIRRPAEVAAWLCENLGMRVMRKIDEPPNTHFIADSEGHTMLEIYENPSVDVPDYASMHPLLLHLAFLVDDVAGVRERLLAAGALPEGDVTKTPEGDELAIVRGPSGLPIQLMKRNEPILE